MLIKEADLEELKYIYLKHYGTSLSNKQVLDLGTKLVNLFKIVAKSIPAVDIKKDKSTK